MPLYDYKCKQCDKVITLTLKLDDPKPDGLQCDTCHIDLTRVYSSIGVTFNGSGFYSTGG